MPHSFAVEGERKKYFLSLLTGSILFFSTVFIFFAFLPRVEAQLASLPTPLTPDTSLTSTEIISEPLEEKKTSNLLEVLTTPTTDKPLRLIIPSIRLNAPVQNVGLNEKGEMDVPNGKTPNVGWYEKGTLPGDTGSAVMDAHVYAAFSRLRFAKIGSEVIVEMESGKKLRFEITESLLYKLEDVPREILFNRADDERLNLITCAGKWNHIKNTYEKRLIVYTKLIEE